jgi:hypothetical protein
MLRGKKYWQEKAGMWRKLFFVTDKMLQVERQNSAYWKDLYFQAIKSD